MAGARMIAAERWAAMLAAWAIPQEILDQAPESPWGFPPSLFGGTPPPGALHRCAAAGLGTERSVLDVGCGGGAASLPLAPAARLLVGVDSSPEMLAAFAAGAETAGAAHREILGDWPAIAAAAPVTDVVVCRNVVYNVAGIGPFVDALAAHASRRVVVELTARHPSVALRPLWQRFWGLERPDGPDAGLFIEVVAERGFVATTASEIRPLDKAARDQADYVRFVRRRLCLPAAAEPEVASALAATGDAAATSGEIVVVSWDTEGQLHGVT